MRTLRKPTEESASNLQIGEPRHAKPRASHRWFGSTELAPLVSHQPPFGGVGSWVCWADMPWTSLETTVSLCLHLWMTFTSLWDVQRAGWDPIFIQEISRWILQLIMWVTGWITAGLRLGFLRSARRLIAFVDRLEADGWLVMVRCFQEFHGRLGFAAQVLPWLRPLLAPGYTWMAAVGKGSTVKTPELVAAVCLFIKEKLKGGLRKTPCSQGETDLGEVFRTDAKCEDARIVLGGWMTYGGVKSSEATLVLGGSAAPPGTVAF